MLQPNAPLPTPLPSPLDDFGASLLSSILTASEPGPSGPLVGTCTEDRHPVLAGRVRIRYEVAGQAQERWMPCLTQVVVRQDDRVLFLVPTNLGEPVVVGVLDGLRERQAEPKDVPCLEVKMDERLRIVDDAGLPLLDIQRTEGRLELKLAQPGADLAVPGTLRMTADTIALEARRGMVLRAGDDVIVRGETISLN